MYKASVKNTYDDRIRKRFEELGLSIRAPSAATAPIATTSTTTTTITNNNHTNNHNTYISNIVV